MATKKTAAADVDEVLGDKPVKKTTKAAAKTDDVLGGKPAKTTKAAAKTAPAKTAPAKTAGKAAKTNGKAAPAAERAPRAASQVNEISAALLKAKKPITYDDFAGNNSFDIRAVRRTARVLRDEGKLKLTKTGTKVTLQASA